MSYEKRGYRFEDEIEYRVEMDSVTVPHSIETLKRNDPFYSEYEAKKERQLKEFEKRIDRGHVSNAEKEKRKELFLLTL